MASDFPDSSENRSVRPPAFSAAKGERRGPAATAAWIEAGVFVETTPAGHLARVVGAGDLIQDEGVWVTDGTCREAETDRAEGEPDDRLHAAVDRRTRVLKARLDCLMTHTSLTRLTDLLATLAARTGEARIVLTQQELADMVGLRRATVNESLQALQDRRMLRVGRGRIDILDPAALAKAACGCESRQLRLPFGTAAGVSGGQGQA